MKVFLALLSLIASAADYRAGIGRVKITPETPIFMSGYANRNHPSEGVVQDLWAKALAIEDKRGSRVVIVTTDLIGLPRDFADDVAARIRSSHKLDRARLILNSSHTHTGPVVGNNLRTMFTLKPEEERAIDEYASRLASALTEAADAAIRDLAPANLGYSAGSAAFAVNRREFTPKGVRLGVNLQGPVDHSVPVLRVLSQDGKLRAVLFGYACHNTTLGGDFYKLNGDYAGFAQEAIERSHPGASALFFMLCGADQNPRPRGKIEDAERNGKDLAESVSRVLAGARFARIRGPIRAAWQETWLEFAPHTREHFEKLRGDKVPARARLGEKMVALYDRGQPIRSISYPVQAVGFGRDLKILALAGEVVVGYALRAKQEFPKERLIVAGYSNDVMCYIPTAQILKEGGYEAVDSMVYYGQPGPFAPDVEERIFAAVRSVLREIGR